MSPSILKKYAVLIFVCVSSSLFFLGLYRFNNKYSQKTIQAANGILALSEKDLQEAPLRFLVSGWAFYPGVLLTPEELQDSVHYMRYISIGEQTGFSSPDSASPYGCGTYQMTFFLPERKGGYALELPEVFSSCLLYLDDDLILQMGDPAAGTPVIQHRLITFYGGKPVTLTAAVSNYDHFYGGIVYPPAFGTPLAVNTARGVRFAVCLFFCTITLICALLSFYFGLRMKQKNAQLFGMICLSLCGLSSYPVLHMLAAVPVFPWYMLELACNYLVIWLVILLQNRICSPGLVPAAVSNTAGGVLFLAALGYGAMASRLSPAAVRLFSASVSFCKVAFSLYLLLTAMAALRRGLKLHRAVFYAAVAAACASAWDRLLPSYEPFIGGWFMEWGIFFVTAAIGSSLWNDMVEGYRNSLILQEECRQVQRQLAMQEEYDRKISEAVSENRRLFHDIRHCLRTLGQMAREHGQTDICAFLSQVEDQVASAPGHSLAAFCKNPAVNALIEFYSGMAQAQKTELQVRLSLPDQMPLTDVELCTVLGNLLDNAVEACSLQDQGERRILLAGESQGSMLFLKVENTCSGPAKQADGHFLSRKGSSPYHGLGLASVQKIVEAHGGDLDIVSNDTSFFVGITMEL